jgi:hypothetical protein
MSDLNILLRRMNQRGSDPGHLENAATTLLLGVVAFVALAALL